MFTKFNLRDWGSTIFESWARGQEGEIHLCFHLKERSDAGTPDGFKLPKNVSPVPTTGASVLELGSSSKSGGSSWLEEFAEESPLTQVTNYREGGL
jgi:hypothetical protein